MTTLTVHAGVVEVITGPTFGQYTLVERVFRGNLNTGPRVREIDAGAATKPKKRRSKGNARGRLTQSVTLRRGQGCRQRKSEDS